MTYPSRDRSGSPTPGRQKYGRVPRRMLACGLLFSLALASGCFEKTSAPAPSEASFGVIKEVAPEALSWDAQIIYSHLVLTEALDKGDMETALAEAEELVKKAPAPEVYIQLSILYERSREPEKALEAISQGAGKYPDNFALHMVWTELLEQHGRQDQALGVIKSFAQQYDKLDAPTHAARLNELGSVRQYTLYLLLNSRRFDEASAYLSGIPQDERTPTLEYYEVVLLRNQGKQQLANSKLLELVKNYPEFTDGWLTLATDMERTGNYKRAVDFYNKALESNPVTEIYLRMLNAQIRSGDVTGAQNQVIASPFSAEVKTQAAVMFMDSKEYKAARAILLTLQNDPYAADDAAMYLGMISYDTGENVDEALGRLQDISPDAANRSRMMYLKALLYIRADDYASAFEAARALRDEYPENRDHWAFLAELANVSKNYKEAEIISREALEEWPEDTSLMYSMAMSLSFQKLNNQAIQVFEDILLLDETNLMAMNALAYTLAEEKRDLPRALALVQRALSREPDNSSILDTLAWVYYQMGNHQDAWKTINRSVAKGVQDAIIWDHYGDIALALNDKSAARMGYAKALELEAENSADIKKKLRNLD